jgi:hypothetical protein
MEHLFDVYAIVKRTTSTIGEYNRPVVSEKVINTYPGRLSRRTLASSVKTPQTEAYVTMRFYTVSDADIQAGDMVVINGTTYIAEPPYYVSNHIEVDLTYTKEV